MWGSEGAAGPTEPWLESKGGRQNGGQQHVKQCTILAKTTLGTFSEGEIKC